MGQRRRSSRRRETIKAHPVRQRTESPHQVTSSGSADCRSSRSGAEVRHAHHIPQPVNRKVPISIELGDDEGYYIHDPACTSRQSPKDVASPRE